MTKEAELRPDPGVAGISEVGRPRFQGKRR